MAAVEGSDPIATRAPARSRGSWLALCTVAAGYCLTVLVFYPGYSTADARYVYADAMAWRFCDWQSPAIAGLLRVLHPIPPRAAGTFLLTASPVPPPLGAPSPFWGGCACTWPASPLP